MADALYLSAPPLTHILPYLIQVQVPCVLNKLVNAQGHAVVNKIQLELDPNEGPGSGLHWSGYLLDLDSGATVVHKKGKEIGREDNDEY